MKRSMINNYALFVSMFLLAAGIWGTYSNIVFKLLTTNQITATIHITIGITGIILGLRHKARPFLILMSILLPIVGILNFISVTNPLVVSLLNINDITACLYIVGGIFGLLVAHVGKRDGYTENTISNSNL